MTIEEIDPQEAMQHSIRSLNEQRKERGLPQLDLTYVGDLKPKPKSNFGVAASVVLIGLCFLVFPRWITLTDWLTWPFYVIGFVVLLFGLIGFGVEWDKR